MKKTNLLFAMVLLSGCLIACDNTSESASSPNSDAVSTSNSSSTDPNSSSVDPIVGGEVTAEQWEQQLNEATQFTIVNTYVQYDLSYTTKIDGDKVLIDGTEHQILSKEENSYYLYSEYYEDDKYLGWVRETITEDEYSSYSFIQKNMLRMFKDNFNDFTYSNDIYTCAFIDKTNTIGATFVNVSITFKNGALSNMKFEMEDNDEILPSTIAFEIKNIGSTTIELPTEFKDIIGSSDSSEVSEEGWQNALSESAFTNFTATIEFEGESYELIVDLDNGVYYFNDNSGSEYYYSNEGDNYYIYAKKSNESEYTRRETTQEYFSEQLLAIEAMAVLMFEDCFEEAEYNPETNSYVAESVTIDGYTYGIEFKFENGKLVYADIDLGEGSHLIIEYTNYDSTEVTLPSSFVEDGGKEKELSFEELRSLVENAEDKNYTKVVITNDGREDTYIYGKNSWDDATSGGHLTVDLIDSLDQVIELGMSVKFVVQDDLYLMIVDFERDGITMHQETAYDSDFYLVYVIQETGKDGDVFSKMESQYTWSYASQEELA